MLSRSRLISQYLNYKPLYSAITRASRMSTFTLPDSSPPVSVNLTQDLSKDQLLSFPAFKNWVSTLQHSLSLQQSKDHTFHASPYILRNIHIQSVDFFGGERIGFIKLKAEVSNDNGEKLPGSVFLRGGSVGMMVAPLLARSTNLEAHFPQLGHPPTGRRPARLRNRQTRNPNPSTPYPSRLTRIG